VVIRNPAELPARLPLLYARLTAGDLSAGLEFLS
jgi:hypothetical protein